MVRIMYRLLTPAVPASALSGVPCPATQAAIASAESKRGSLALHRAFTLGFFALSSST